MEHTFVFVLLFSLTCYVVALGPTTLPSTPLQFTAQFNTSTYGDFPYNTFGTIYYDYINQKVRWDYYENFDNSTNNTFTYSQTNDYINLWEFAWDPADEYCFCGSTYGPQVPVFLPYGSVFIGTAKVGNNIVNIWNWTDYIVTKGNLVYEFEVDSNNTIISATVNNTYGGNWNTFTTYSNITLGPPNPNLFKVPSTCDNCPTYPGPTPGSCPKSPGQGCDCPSPSDFSFCTEVNYPILNYLHNVPEVDKWVQQVYEQTISTLSSPSQLCLSNFKSYLCSYYFAQCSGNSYFPGVTSLPCSSMCTSCSCGDSPLPLNCTFDNNKNGCTLYGKPYC